MADPRAEKLALVPAEDLRVAALGPYECALVIRHGMGTLLREGTFSAGRVRKSYSPGESRRGDSGRSHTFQVPVQRGEKHRHRLWRALRANDSFYDETSGLALSRANASTMKGAPSPRQ